MRRLRFLQPEYLFTWPAFWISFLWALLLHFADPEYRGYRGSYLERIALLAFIHVCVFGLLYLVRRLIDQRLTRSQAVMAFGLSIVVVSALRGLGIGAGLVRLHIVEQVDWWFRLTTSMTNMSLALVLVWIVSSGVRSHSDRQRQLLQEQDLLTRLQQQALEHLSEFDDEAVSQIRQSLLSRIRDISTDSASLALQQMHSIVEDVVRPLSRLLEAQGGDWQPPALTSYALHFDWAKVLREAFEPRRIRPAILMALSILVATPNTLFTRGPVVVAASMVNAAVVAMPVLVILRWMGMRLTSAGTLQSKRLAFFGATFVGGILVGISSILYMSLSSLDHFAYVPLGPVSALVIAPLVAIAETAQEQATAVDSELEGTTEELRWSLARAREQHRQQRRALAHTLHGRVQASLASAILRLQMAQRAGADLLPLLNSERQELLDSIAQMDFRTAHPDPLDVVLERVTTTWDGVASFAVHLDQDLYDILQRDELCATAVNDLVPELVFNAIKHGRAELIDIDMRLLDPRTVQLSVTDDGAAELASNSRGLGTQLLDDAAITWRRERISGRTCTTALLPFAP